MTSKILVGLVEGCETQDLVPAIDAIRENKEVEVHVIEIYKTLLLLLRTQSPQLFPRLISTVSQPCNQHSEHLKCKRGKKSQYDKLFIAAMKLKRSIVVSGAITFRSVFK